MIIWLSHLLRTFYDTQKSHKNLFSIQKIVKSFEFGKKNKSQRKKLKQQQPKRKPSKSETGFEGNSKNWVVIKS